MYALRQSGVVANCTSHLLLIHSFILIQTLRLPVSLTVLNGMHVCTPVLQSSSSYSMVLRAIHSATRSDPVLTRALRVPRGTSTAGGEIAVVARLQNVLVLLGAQDAAAADGTVARVVVVDNGVVIVVGVVGVVVV